jgi:hypothetical protein
MKPSFVAGFALLAKVYAQPCDSEPTASQHVFPDESALQATAAPEFEFVKRRLEDNIGLRKRVTSGQVTAYQNTGSVCGYIGGKYGMASFC